MAETKVINLEIKDNAKEVEKHIEDLVDAGEQLKKAFKDVNSTFEDVYGDLKPLSARMGEAQDRLYELSLAGKQNTQEYKELLQATANYRKVQIQTDLVVDTAARTLSEKLVLSLEGAASGFALAQGAMGLFGDESEEVQRAMLKVQSAMALTQGIEGVRTAIPLFKSFGGVIKNAVVGAFTTLRGAIISTGIGALVVAIGVIIPKIIEWSDWTGRAQKAQEKLNEALLEQQTQIKESRKELEKDLQFREQYAKALGKSDDELLKIQKQNNIERNEAIRNEIEAARKRLQSLREVDLGVMASSKEEYLELVKNNYNKRKEIVAEIQQLQTEIKDNNNQILLAETQLNTNKENLRKQDVESSKSTQKEIIKDTKDYYKELSDLQDEQYRLLQEATLNQQELEIFNLVEQYDKKFEIANGNAELEIALQEKLKKQIAEINEKYAVKDVELTQETEDKKEEIVKMTEEQKLQLARNTINSLIGLTDLFNAKNEKDARRQFKINKALSLAQASIQTFQAITGALTAGGNPIKLATGTQFIEAGIAAAIGGANIAKIAATQFDGFGDAEDTVKTKTTNISAPTAQPSQVNFNTVGASGQSQLENLQPIKAYVVSGDVTTQQALDRNRIQNATF